MFIIKIKSLPARLFLVKWMSWYLSGANFVPCHFAHAIHLLCIWFSLVQFSVTVLPHIIKFILFTNPNAIVFWLLLNVLKNSDMKNKNRINDRGNLCRIPVGVGIRSFSYSLNTILVVCPIKKA